MEVEYSKRVIRILENYKQVLTSDDERYMRYKRSPKRAKEKADAMIAAIRRVGENPFAYPICNKRDLGQRFDANGRPKFDNLRTFLYRDESGFQWAFSYKIFPKLNLVRIQCMKGSNMVRESTSRTIRLTESQLHGLIQDTLKLILKDIAS